jgi:tryptophan synthase alpha chain
MTARIAERFAALAGAKRKALIPFVMGGDPDMESTGKIISLLPQAGADIIEIGMPFSDPMADGKTIQAAGLRALNAGANLKGILQLVRDFRKKDVVTPIILMGYYNPVYRYGLEPFCRDAKEAGADGVILADLPPEEESEFSGFAGKHGIRIIRLVAPTTDDGRLGTLLPHAGGFLYYIAVAGVTGTKTAEAASLKISITHLKTKTLLPVAVGFGIKTPEQAAEIARFSDGVVVGSALVEIMEKGSLQAAVEFVKSLRAALDKAA